VVALWEELARRYREHPTVAGYNVVNEPQTRPGDVVWLNRFYRRVTAAIRAIDDRHILFLEGDQYSARFDQLDPPFDGNTVYSSHSYPAPALDHFAYPGVYNGVSYDRDVLKKEYLGRTAFMRQHGVPHWFGEFGCVYTGEVPEDSRLRVMADMMAIADEQGDHWTIWTYKDIGRMGLVCPAPDSEWMRRTAPVRQAKTALRCDSWVERPPVEIEGLIQQIAGHARTTVVDLPGEWAKLGDLLRTAVCDGLLSRALLPAFAGQFRGMSEDDVDQMMQSFAFQNCAPREGLVRLLRSRLQGG
jgi:hypothetical protein